MYAVHNLTRIPVDVHVVRSSPAFLTEGGVFLIVSSSWPIVASAVHQVQAFLSCILSLKQKHRNNVVKGFERFSPNVLKLHAIAQIFETKISRVDS